MSEKIGQFVAEQRRVEVDGVALMCHHPREGIWCCCAEEGPAQCCCGGSLDGAVRAWFRNERCGE